MVSFAFPSFRDALEATKKAVERYMRPSRYMGRHGQQTAPVSLSEASGAVSNDTTKNVIVPGLFSGYSHRFNLGVEQGNENNGVISGCEANMSKGNESIELDKLADGYMIGDRVLNGQRGELLFAISPNAQEAASRLGYMSLQVNVLIMWVPKVNSDDVAPTLEAQGAEISCV